MGWLYILLAGIGEIIFIIGLKQQNRIKALAFILTATVVIGYFLNQALLLIDSSIVYPLWVSIGSLWSLLMGRFLYGELLNRKQLSFIGLLFFGCIGLVVGGA